MCGDNGWGAVRSSCGTHILIILNSFIPDEGGWYGLKDEWWLSKFSFIPLSVVVDDEYLCEIVLTWVQQDPTDEKWTVVQVMDWCCQATNHCLNQCLPTCSLPYYIICRINLWRLSVAIYSMLDQWCLDLLECDIHFDSYMHCSYCSLALSHWHVPDLKSLYCSIVYWYYSFDICVILAFSQLAFLALFQYKKIFPCMPIPLIVMRQSYLYHGDPYTS